MCLSSVVDIICGFGVDARLKSRGSSGRLKSKTSDTRVRVSRKIVRYVLISPRWVLLVNVVRGRLEEIMAFGPVFSSQV